ncbi:MAG: toprim domain-containing protein [Clostridia bacterium]|nr:toprim domain-containing protein [Clostridia bacterium]
MKLVVIESPGKRETLQKYLGKDYLVVSSKGHVRDLPIKSFAVDLTKNYEPKYEILPDKYTVIEDIKKKAEKAEEILLATDPDREGEAIAWHLAYCLNVDPNSKCRIVFNEISKSAVEKALLAPREIDLNLVDAQQARRILDRIMGYKLSPILCKKIKPKLSAGRVQSVCLRLVVDREKEIEDFKPEEYWNVNAELKKQTQSMVFKSSLTEYKGKKVKLSNKEEVDSVISGLNTAAYIVDSIKKTKSKSKAPTPFTTSSMQQEALNKLNMTL